VKNQKLITGTTAAVAIAVAVATTTIDPPKLKARQIECTYATYGSSNCWACWTWTGPSTGWVGSGNGWC
jgi:hypothetical protein